MNKRVAVVTYLCLPVFLLAEAQTIHPTAPTVVDLNKVAEKFDTLPPAIAAIRDDVASRRPSSVRARNASAGTGTAANCGEYLVGAPAVFSVVQQTTVYFFEGCGLPAGTWILSSWAYPDGSGEATYYRLTQDVPAQALFSWAPKAPPSPAGGTFTLTVLPEDANWRIFSTLFGGPIQFDAATEQAVIGANGSLIRTIIVAGVYGANPRVLYGYADVSDRAVSVAPNVISIDVSDIELQQGEYYPLTVVQGAGFCQTALIYNGPSPGKG